MKIAATSDTLGNLPEIIGEFDLFIHCGNFSPQFEYISIESQIEKQTDWMEFNFKPWLQSIRATHKIVIAGHLDFGAQWISRDLQYHIGATTLQDESITLNHNLIHGMNWLMPSKDLSIIDPSITGRSVYILKQKERFIAACKLIPDDVDILITRMPPYGILDEVNNKNVGSSHLLDRIKELKKVKLHIFGLISETGGSYIVSNNVTYANASVKGFIELSI